MNKKILKILEKSESSFSKKNIDDKVSLFIKQKDEIKNFTVEDFLNGGFKSEKSKLMNSILGSQLPTI